MQYDQFKGMTDRVILVLATWFLGWMVKKGWIGESDAAAFTSAIILLPALAVGWWVNRDKALLQSAANVINPNTQKPVVIVAGAAMAADTPENTNIVSSAKVEVKNK